MALCRSPLITKLSILPLLAKTSLAANSVTSSEKVAVTVNKPECGSSAFDVSTTIGGVWSTVVVSEAAAVFALPASSENLNISISINTSPSATGVTSKVALFRSPIITKLSIVPLLAKTSLAANSVTASEKVAVTVNKPQCVSPSFDVSVTVGGVTSGTGAVPMWNVYVPSTGATLAIDCAESSTSSTLNEKPMCV